MSSNFKAAPRLSRQRKLAFAAALATLLFLALEASLRFSGAFPESAAFSEFTGDDGRAMVRFNLEAPFPSFPRRKPAGTLRIFIAGASSVVGFPFQPRSSIGSRLSALLAAALPGREIEVITVGQMSMWSGEVAEVVEDCLAYDPDLIVVYSGQNEFLSLGRRRSSGREALVRVLSRSRVFTALAGLTNLTVGALGDAGRDWAEDSEQGLVLPPPPPLGEGDYERALKEYEANLGRMARAARSAQVPLALCTLAVNLADWPPSPRAYPRGWDQADRSAARAVLDQGILLLDQGRAGEAAAFLEAAQQQRPEYAPFAFYLGRARRAMSSDPLHAYRDFERALALEARQVISRRAPPEFNRLVKKAAASNQVMLLDVAALFENSGGSPGFDWFEDHCHPNLAGQQKIAEAMFRLLRNRGLPAPAGEWREPPSWDEGAFAAAHGLDGPFRSRASMNMGIFLGIKVRLPGRSAAIRADFARAYEYDPTDPLALLFEAVTALHYPGPDDSYGKLAELYLARPGDLEAALARYITSRADLRAGVLMVRVSDDPDAAPLEGLVRKEIFKAGLAEGARVQRPRSYYNRFIDLKAGGAAAPASE